MHLLGLYNANRLRVFQNRVLRRIFGPKRDAVTGEWRKLHNNDLYYLCCSSTVIWMIISKRMVWVGHVARIREGKSAYCVLERHETVRSLRTPRLNLEDNIKVNLK